jgi:hypothetical protein
MELVKTLETQEEAAKTQNNELTSTCNSQESKLCELTEAFNSLEGKLQII